MNTAICTLSLLMGGVVLPEIVPPTGVPGVSVYQPPRTDLGSSRSQAGYRPGSGYRSGGQSARSFGGRTSSPLTGTPQGTGAARQNSIAPLAPTDPSAGANRFPWGAPTAGAPTDPTGTAAGSTVGGAGPYNMPTRARPSYAPRPSSSVRRPGPVRSGSASAGSATANKPFSGYRRQRLTSPYMQLYRSNNSYGTIDNWNELVRPALEQQQQNRQLSSDVRGLQGATRSQGLDLRTLGRATQGLQGSANRQYYMNYGGYFPALGR